MIKAKVENPEDVEITITVTNTLRDWKLISRDLQLNSGQSLRLSEGIRDAILKVTQEFENGD